MTKTWDFLQIRPSFLDLLDSNKPEAMKQFGLGFERHFKNFHSRDFRGLDEDTIADLLSDLKVHCLKDNCRVIRKYQVAERPFAHWFTVVAHNRFVEVLRSRKQMYSLDSPAGPDQDPVEPPDRSSDNKEDVFWRQLLRLTEECIQLASTKCRRMLLLAAEECTPLELAQLLGFKPEENKKVSDDLRYCRRQLVNCLEGKGIAEADWPF